MRTNMTASTMLVLQLLALIYIQYDAAKVTANEPRAHLGYQNADSHQLRTSASNDNPNTRKLCTFDEFVPGNDDLLPYERCYEVKFEEGGGCRDDHDVRKTYLFDVDPAIHASSAISLMSIHSLHIQFVFLFLFHLDSARTRRTVVTGTREMVCLPVVMILI